ncbi:hypothetical protein [Paenibacillus harenae]|nr:hypothetical protein [Paenibacillus harenae]
MNERNESVERREPIVPKETKCSLFAVQMVTLQGLPIQTIWLERRS